MGISAENLLLQIQILSSIPITVGTKILADPKQYIQELIPEKSLILLRDGPCLELIIVSSAFQALLFLQNKLLESLYKSFEFQKKSLNNYWIRPFQN